jgi:integrase/recombinase XerD
MELQKANNGIQNEILLHRIPGTPSGYNNILFQFDRFRIEKNLPLDFETVRSFLSLPKLRGDGEYSPSSMNTRKKALSSTLKKITSDLRIIHQLDKGFKEIKNFKIERIVHSEEILNWRDIHSLIKGTKNLQARNWGTKFGNKRERFSLIIETLAVTGMRISELTGIMLKDCHSQGEFTFIKVMGKGSKPRRIFIPKELFDRIKIAFNSKQYLFLSVRGKRMNRTMIHTNIQDLGIRILGRNIHPHIFRHSFATREIKKKGSVKAVSRYLGHASTSITEEMYLHDELTPGDLFAQNEKKVKK